MIIPPIAKIKKRYLLLERIKRYSKNRTELIWNLIKNSEKYRIILFNNNIINIHGRYNVYTFFELLDDGWKVKECDNDRCIVCNGNICLEVRTTYGADLIHLHELWTQNTYGNNFHGVVIDIGASNADSAIYFAIHGAEKVIALEPYPESYDLGRKNISMNNLENKIELLPYALSAKDGEIEFKISTLNPNANSIDPQAPIIQAGIKFDKIIKVKTISLQSLFKQFNLEKVSLLKMDCEGCEYEVLRNTPPEIFRKIEEIVLEYHNYPQDIPQILEKNGFKIVQQENKATGIIKAINSKINN